MSRLAPCSSCHRHVRVEAGGCPFCGAELLRCAAPSPWLRRLTLVSAIAGLGTLAACDRRGTTPAADGESSPGESADAAGSASGATTSGGAVAPDSDDSPLRQPTIYGGPSMMSGGPPPEVPGVPDDGAEVDDGGPPGPEVDIYGGPRRDDSVPIDPGTIDGLDRPESEPPKKIYGGPRMDRDPEPKTPQKTIYGGPRPERPSPE